MAAICQSEVVKTTHRGHHAVGYLFFDESGRPGQINAFQEREWLFELLWINGEVLDSVE